VGGLFTLFGLVTGSQIDNYNFETLTTVTQQLALLAAKQSRARCAEAPVIAGTRCDDVQAALLHISLSGLPESPARVKLLAIPTGLTLKRADVDALVQAGHDAVVNSASLRAFLDDYPPARLRVQ
jgi:hypothetical protein